MNKEKSKASSLQTFQTIKQIAFYTFFLITFGTSLYAYLGMASVFFEYIIMAVLIIGIESFKVFSIIDGNIKLALYHIYKKRNNDIFKKKLRQAITSYLAYGLCAAISTAGSLSFTVSTVTKYEDIAASQDNSMQISSIEDRLKFKQNELQAFADERKKWVDLDPIKYISQIRRLDTLMKIKNTEIETLSTSQDTKQENQKIVVKTIKKSLYEIIGKEIHISPKLIVLFLMGIASLTVEVGLWKCSPHLISEDREGIIKRKRLLKHNKNLIEDEIIEEEEKIAPIAPTSPSMPKKAIIVPQEKKPSIIHSVVHELGKEEPKPILLKRIKNPIVEKSIGTKKEETLVKEIVVEDKYRNKETKIEEE